MFESKVIPLDKWVETAVDYIVTNYRDFFQTLKLPVEKILHWLIWALNSINPIVIIIVIAFLAYRFSGKRLCLFTILSFVFIGLLGLWSQAMTTLAMISASVFFCVVVGIPLGILCAKSDKIDGIIRPILDAMQTTPSFVYLIPVVMLFSIGNVSGVIATIVFALPPIVRLTNLGIRQVDKEVVEAGMAFGATKWQLLTKVQIPLAWPTILAGLNQTIMMALSMVVIAALIGAGGLGEPVFRGLNNLDIGLAFIGGISIVLIAIVLDRITQAIGQKYK